MSCCCCRCLQPAVMLAPAACQQPPLSTPAQQIGPGQITDDTELALCLADGLAGADPAQAFPADAVAARYAWWFWGSEPFDVGTTCSQDFSVEASGRLGEAMAARASSRSQVRAASREAAPAGHSGRLLPAVQR